MTPAGAKQKLTSSMLLAPDYGTEKLIRAQEILRNERRRDYFCNWHPLSAMLIAAGLIIMLVAIRQCWPIHVAPENTSRIFSAQQAQVEDIVYLNAFVKPEPTEPAKCQLKPPLFLSQYIRENNTVRGRELSRVLNLPGDTRHLISYSGFITVNESDGSNTFFWLFETTNETVKTVENAPLILYLDGGPGVSSIDSLLDENGPIGIDEHLNFYDRAFSWTELGDVLYVDNPVGTGFSFTSTDSGYSTNQVQIGWNLYNFLVQFYQLFPTYLTRPLFLTGESYAGKYVPALAYRIHEQNKLKNSTLKVPLVGIAISGSWSDPENMISAYGPFFYNMGLFDRVGEQLFNNATAQIVRLIKEEKFEEAFHEDDKLIAGEFAGKNATLFYNLTGFEDVNTILSSKKDVDVFVSYITRCDVRNALHVGNTTFRTNDKKVLYELRADICDTVRHWLPTVYENYRTLIFTGQFDIIVGAPLVEQFLAVLEGWSAREAYLSAPQQQWRVRPGDREIAGYVKQVGSQFYHAVVRGAGHLVAHDTPERCNDLLYRFFYNKTFS